MARATIMGSGVAVVSAVRMRASWRPPPVCASRSGEARAVLADARVWRLPPLQDSANVRPPWTYCLEPVPFRRVPHLCDEHASGVLLAPHWDLSPSHSAAERSRRLTATPGGKVWLSRDRGIAPLTRLATVQAP